MASAGGDNAKRGPISREEVEGPGDALIDEAHLTVFLTWIGMGGMEHPPSLTEIAEMDATLRHDILFLVREYGDAKDTQRRMDKAAKGGKRK